MPTLKWFDTVSNAPSVDDLNDQPVLVQLYDDSYMVLFFRYQNYKLFWVSPSGADVPDTHIWRWAAIPTLELTSCTPTRFDWCDGEFTVPRITDKEDEEKVQYIVCLSDNDVKLAYCVATNGVPAQWYDDRWYIIRKKVLVWARVPVDNELAVEPVEYAPIGITPIEELDTALQDLDELLSRLVRIRHSIKTEIDNKKKELEVLDKQYHSFFRG